VDSGDLRPADLAAFHLAAIVEWSEDAIVSKDLHGVIRSWNRAAERMFGYSAAEAVGRHITLIIPEERRAEEDEVLRRIRKGEAVEHFETIRQAKDGTRLSISLTVSPIRDESGTVIGASKIARDIGERKRFEAEQAALLAREQKALAEAEAANRARDEFLAMLSHELRNPLNAITAALHVAEAGSLGEHAVKARQVVARQVGQLVRLVDDLLDLTRLATGKIVVRPSPVDLGAVARRVVAAVADAAPGRHIACRAQDDLWIRADETRLEQILVNLLNNAMKFTPASGRVSVTVTDDGPDAVLRVEDTGAGIAPELLPRVFDLFVQGQTHRKNSGLGIGLTLVKRLVDLHGGRIDVTSPGPGQGSVFTIRLPRIPPTHRV
jgi:PAS domain S-box-containing protein